MTMTDPGGAAAPLTADMSKATPAPAPPRAADSGTPLADPEHRRVLRKALGNGYLFGLSILLLFATAGAIEIYGTQESFKLYCGLLFLEIALPAFVAGLIAKGRVLGVLIDDRNRMSLGRFQVFSWSLFILASYFAMAIWNSRFGGKLPQVPENLWILLGITNASAVAGAMVLNPKRRYTQAVAQSQSAAADDPGNATPPPAPAIHQSLLDVKERPSHANWTDLFFGEEASNKDTVDVSRLQQFAFTLILLFVFAGKVFDRLATAGPGVLDMPDLDSSALGLLGFSNVSYLAAKQAAKPAVTAQ